MEGNEIIINAAIITLIVPLVYTITYFIKGKEKSFFGFCKMLFCSALILYISAIIPAIILAARYTNVDSNDYIAKFVIDILALLFSVPFFAELIKCLERDFEIHGGFKDNALSVMMYIAISVLLTGVAIMCVTGYISGGLSVSALLAGVYMFLCGIFVIISSAYEKYVGKDIIKFNNKLIWIISIFTVIFFIAVIIFETVT